MKRKETDDDGDEGIPDDEQINEMLARSEVILHVLSLLPADSRRK